MRSYTWWRFYFRGKKCPKMCLKINWSVNTPWHRPSMGVARSGLLLQLLTLETSNNQRLRRCARGRSKVKPLLLHGCGLHKFHVTDVQNTRNQLQVIEGPNARENCVKCIPFVLSMRLCKLHTCDACVITTWRLGLQAPLVVRNNSAFLTWLRSAKQGSHIL